jgi:hypothetical protein
MKRGARTQTFFKLFKCSVTSTKILKPLNVPPIPKSFFVLVVAIHNLSFVSNAAFFTDNCRGPCFARIVGKAKRRVAELNASTTN